MANLNHSYPRIRPPRLELEKTIENILSDLNPGDQLPPEPELARQLGVSRALLREVMTRFVERGSLIRKHGLGTFAGPRGPYLETGLEVLESLDSLAKKMGLETEIRDLVIEERQASPEELKGFRQSTEANFPVLFVSRVVCVSAQPVAYLIDVVPLKYLRRENLDGNIHGSIFDILVKRGLPPLAYSRTEILAENASRELSGKLDIERGTALICLTGNLFTNDEEVVDHSHSYFVPGHFKFHVNRRLEKPVFDST